MTDLNLRFLKHHPFVVLDDGLWLLDTGAATSFGQSRKLRLAGVEFSVGSNYLGLGAEQLSEFVGVPTAGLLGADVLERFDLLIDVANERLTLSTGQLAHEGLEVPMDDFMGVPIINVRIGDDECRMFFDSGAQISYFEGEMQDVFPRVGSLTDFFPGVGQFETETYRVPVDLAGETIELVCGQLPGLLGMTLMMAGTQGILGNAILSDRKVGYFPRRGLLVL
jgi:hypothetical protein